MKYYFAFEINNYLKIQLNFVLSGRARHAGLYPIDVWM